MATIEPQKSKTKKPRAHECLAVLPDGVTARRVTSHRYKAALAVPQIGSVGSAQRWVVLRWSASKKELETEARRRIAQTHGERTAVVVDVEIVPR